MPVAVPESMGGPRVSAARNHPAGPAAKPRSREASRRHSPSRLRILTRWLLFLPVLINTPERHYSFKRRFQICACDLPSMQCNSLYMCGRGSCRARAICKSYALFEKHYCRLLSIPESGPERTPPWFRLMQVDPGGTYTWREYLPPNGFTGEAPRPGQGETWT